MLAAISRECKTPRFKMLSATSERRKCPYKGVKQTAAPSLTQLWRQTFHRRTHTRDRANEIIAPGLTLKKKTVPSREKQNYANWGDGESGSTATLKPTQRRC